METVVTKWLITGNMDFYQQDNGKSLLRHAQCFSCVEGLGEKLLT